MIRRFHLPVLVAFAGTLCAGTPGDAADRPVVITTNTILADMTSEVAGNLAEVHCLVARGVEVHGFEPLPSDVARLTEADLLIANGAGFEPWLERLVAGSGFSGKIVRTAASCDLLTQPASDGGEAVVDPHAWHDPRNGLRYVTVIRDALVAADPAHEPAYRDRARLYSAQLEVLDSWIRRLLAPLPPARRHLVTAHDSLAYFARAYQLDITPVKGLDAGQEPDAAQFAGLIEKLRAHDAPVIFAEATADRKVLEQLASEARARIGGELLTDTLASAGAPGGTYFGMLRENALTIADALARN